MQKKVRASRTSSHLHIIRYTLIYIVVSFIWIFASDTILHTLVHDPNLDLLIATSKGFVFVIVTAALYFAMMRQLAKHISDVELSYQTLFDLATDLIFVLDADAGRFIDVNSQAESILGYKKEELVGRKFTELLSPDERDKGSFKIGDLRRTVSLSIERKFTRKDGSQVILESHVRTLPDGRILSISRDVTDRKNAEQALKESEARFTAMFRSSPMPTSLTGIHDSRFLDVNDAFLAMSGFSRHEVIGHEPLELKVWVDTDDREVLLTRLQHEGHVHGMETRFRTKSGGIRDVVVFSEKISVGNFGYMLALMMDVTEKKRAEEELAKTQERSAQLERQLVQAQRLESLGTLASGIAHDFNNLLNIIMGHSSLLPERLSNPEKLATSIEGIARASERGASLVKQLLTFARKTETVFESVDVNSLMDELSKMVYETFPRTIVVSTSFAENLPPIKADASQLHQVFMNLLVNARDAMPRGGDIHIVTEALPGATEDEMKTGQDGIRFISVRITDTGIGMSGETRERIFDPFFTTKAPGKGTGLGLSLAYSIVENHRGRIECESEPGKGTTFRVLLPIVDEVLPPISVTTDSSTPVRQNGHETVLVIEDEEMLVDIVETTLIQGGYKVLSARDGEEGLRIFGERSGEISIVITDLGLPKMGGDEVLRKIKKMSPDSKVVLASGFIDPDLRADLLKAGVNSFMPKPFSPAEILATVRETLDS